MGAISNLGHRQFLEHRQNGQTGNPKESGSTVGTWPSRGAVSLTPVSGPLGIAHGFRGLSAPATATPTAVSSTPTATTAAEATPTVTASPTAATAPAAWVVLVEVIV